MQIVFRSIFYGLLLSTSILATDVRVEQPQAEESLYRSVKKEKKDIIDTIAECCFDKPCEFLYTYRWPIMGALVIVAATAGVYLYGICEHQGNGPHTVRSMPGRFQKEKECGLYAMMHAVHLAGATTEDEARQQLAALSTQDMQQAVDVISALRTAEERGTNLRANNLANDAMEEFLHTGVLGPAGVRIPVVERLSTLDAVCDDALPSVQLFRRGLIALHDRGESQTVVLATGPRGGGHWIAVHLMADATQPGGIRAVATDSVWGNLADHPAVKELVRRSAR